MKSLADTTAVAFCDGTLTKAEWTHFAHLRVGLWHMLHHGVDDALELLRTRIRALNESHGVANSDTGGYHETITRFYVWLTAAFLRNTDRTRPVDDLVVELILRFGDRDLPLTYWSKERLMTPEAGRGWAEPDLRPLR